MRSTSAHAAVLLALVGFACAPPNAATPYPPAGAGEQVVTAESKVAEMESEPVAKPPLQGLATYFDRKVDLAPFLAGFPYGRFRPNLETNKLFFYELGERYTLKMLDIAKLGAGAWKLDTATTLSDVDWSKRSLWSIHHHAASNTLWLHADASNDEKMNLWTLDIASGKLSEVTHHDYVYGLGFSEDEKTLAYLPRKGTKAPFSTCLRIRDVASGDEKEILCDSAKLSFTWSDLRFSPNGSEVYFNAQTKGDRTRVQLVRVNLNAAIPKVELVTNPRRGRNSPQTLKGWLGDELLFVANDDGFSNLHAFNRSTGRVRQVTRFKEDVTSAALSVGVVVGVHRTPSGSTMFVVDPNTGKVLSEKRLKGTADISTAHNGRAIATQSSPEMVFEAYDVSNTASALGELGKVIGLDPELEQQVLQCKATAVQIPTFDKDKKTRKKRVLHAFLLEPKTPAADPGHRLAMITSFYGGGNRYSKFDNIMCAAGMTILSPAVRGSSGFGKAFYSLNDKDLGGDEIVDLFYAARWLEQRTGLPARRIGVKGGSHGGYATMRALTFPPATNGRNESYPLGFGLSHAGFSDIKTFFDATNIPDWVVLESGDPSRPAELKKMKDRSPLQHVDLLRSPLLLTHGSQDWRVPVDESRQFIKAARAAKRPVSYVEIEGQGHHIEGLSLQVQVYQARFDFLKAVAKAAPVK